MYSGLVTVILRIHDEYAGFLPRAWASLVTQTVRPRVIVACDGRSKRVEETFTRLSGDIPGTLVSTPERTGFWAIPCNAVLPWVETPWVSFMDADNEFAPEHLEGLLAAVRGADARPGFAYSRRRYVVDEGFEGEPPVPPGESPLRPWVPENIRRLLASPAGNFIDSGDLLVGKGVLYLLGSESGFVFSPYINRYGDWYLARLLAQAGVPGAAVDAATNIYHWHGENLQLRRARMVAEKVGPGMTVLEGHE